MRRTLPGIYSGFAGDAVKCSKPWPLNGILTFKLPPLAMSGARSGTTEVTPGAVTNDDGGKPLGSSENEFARIFMEPQSWGLISGVADADRAARLIAACDKILETAAKSCSRWTEFPSKETSCRSRNQGHGMK
jgi:hypothetical protein